MKKLIISTMLMMFSLQLKAEALVFHEIRDDETLWFLSEVYYGKGDKYEKIMEANHVKPDTKLEKGQRILIPNPVFHPGSADFEKRFQKLKKSRDVKLAKKGTPRSQPPVAAKPTELFENNKPMKSPEQMATEELQGH